MNRKKIVIDRESFERLCSIQCTLPEIAGFFKCSHDTIERWCKKEYGINYGDVHQMYRQDGLVSLRRIQFKQAEKVPTMAIWLGKQYLGQRDVVSVDLNKEQEDDPLTKAIKETIDGV